MTMHHLPPGRRAVAFIFPAIIVIIAALGMPAFAGTGREWWLLAILALPLILAMVICREYRAVAIGFDAAGVHYRSVGYTLYAPWQTVTFDARGNSPVLRVSQAKPDFFPWLGIMHRALSLLVPYRARRAETMMTSIPLHAFLTAGDGPALQDLRAIAPRGVL